MSRNNPLLLFRLLQPANFTIYLWKLLIKRLMLPANQIITLHVLALTSLCASTLKRCRVSCHSLQRHILILFSSVVELRLVHTSHQTICCWSLFNLACCHRLLFITIVASSSASRSRCSTVIAILLNVTILLVVVVVMRLLSSSWRRRSSQILLSVASMDLRKLFRAHVELIIFGLRCW